MRSSFSFIVASNLFRCIRRFDERVAKFCKLPRHCVKPFAQILDRQVVEIVILNQFGICPEGRRHAQAILRVQWSGFPFFRFREVNDLIGQSVLPTFSRNILLLSKRHAHGAKGFSILDFSQVQRPSEPRSCIRWNQHHDKRTVLLRFEKPINLWYSLTVGFFIRILLGSRLDKKLIPE